MEARPIEEVISTSFAELRAIPEGVHLLCPKTGPDDEEDHANVAETDDAKRKRIQEGKSRVKLAYWCSLVFGMDKLKHEAEIKELNGVLSNWLKTCDQCIINWHMSRKPFLREFAEYVAAWWFSLAGSFPATTGACFARMTDGAYTAGHTTRARFKSLNGCLDASISPGWTVGFNGRGRLSSKRRGMSASSRRLRNALEPKGSSFF